MGSQLTQRKPEKRKREKTARKTAKKDPLDGAID